MSHDTIVVVRSTLLGSLNSNDLAINQHIDDTSITNTAIGHIDFAVSILVQGITGGNNSVIAALGAQIDLGTNLGISKSRVGNLVQILDSTINSQLVLSVSCGDLNVSASVITGQGEITTSGAHQFAVGLALGSSGIGDGHTIHILLHPAAIPLIEITISGSSHCGGAQCQSHDHGQHSCNVCVRFGFILRNSVYNVNIIML